MDEEDINHDTFNSKAMNALVCALSLEKFNRGPTYEKANDIEDTLEMTREAQTK